MSAATAANGRTTHGRAPRVVPPAPEPEPLVGSALMAAMLKVQAEAPTLTPDADGQIQSRTYKYVTLGAVVDAVLALLVKYELAWATFPTSDENGAPALRYKMTHVPSGEYEEDVMPLMCATPDPQGQGSALTYARRYALVAVLNLTTGDDDDGAAAQAGAQAAHVAAQAQAAAGAAAAAPQSPRPTARRPRDSGRPATDKQQGMLAARAADTGLANGEFANVLLVANSEPVREWQDDQAAARWVKRALQRVPAKNVDAVLEGIADAAKAKAGTAQESKS